MGDILVISSRISKGPRYSLSKKSKLLESMAELQNSKLFWYLFKHFRGFESALNCIYNDF